MVKGLNPYEPPQADVETLPVRSDLPGAAPVGLFWGTVFATPLLGVAAWIGFREGSWMTKMDWIHVLQYAFVAILTMVVGWVFARQRLTSTATRLAAASIGFGVCGSLIFFGVAIPYLIQLFHPNKDFPWSVLISVLGKTMLVNLAVLAVYHGLLGCVIRRRLRKIASA